MITSLNRIGKPTPSLTDLIISKAKQKHLHNALNTPTTNMGVI